MKAEEFFSEKCEWNENGDREWCYRRRWSCLIIFGSDFNRFHEVLFIVLPVFLKANQWVWDGGGLNQEDLFIKEVILQCCVSLSPDVSLISLHHQKSGAAALSLEGKGEYPLCTSYFVLNAILNTTTVAIKIMRYIKDTCFK